MHLVSHGVIVSLWAVVKVASLGDPCEVEDATCMRAPCPAPPPGWSHECTRNPNPLVVGEDGKCCPRSLCDTYDCPAFNGCSCDGGSHFCLASEREGSAFDCTRSTNATNCATHVDEESKDTCKCLAGSCRSSQQMLSEQKGSTSSACVLACENPKEWHTICPNYDDNVAWCDYYAVWMCVKDTNQCETKPPQDTCEAKCYARASGSTASDRLDSFLICAGECASGTQRATLV
eukprot:TRINITY_DN70166_c0_g1_i1.p1 TRINITY_DN70166_c0_g1~~TRINITY_DN70166_c0_g1_i1.p1  ORF type:complete len:233 (-),score=13.57 TRINITY_DN70166_c0_g1_i1:47-745(-)